MSVFQVGRYADGGAAAIGFATSANSGRTWTSGILPSLTAASSPAGTAERATDTAVAYDPVRRRWVAESLSLSEASSAVVVSRSADGITWEAPVTVISLPRAGQGEDTQLDKSWITCDTGARSRFRGRCYIAYTDFSVPGNHIGVQSSDDGGLTWSREVFIGITVDIPGVQPVVRPNGQLVLVYVDGPGWLYSIRSNDGGATFTGRELISRDQPRDRAFRPDMLRAFSLPSAAVDGGGTVYVAWPDCQLRADCSGNDIVVARTKSPRGWTAPRRIPVPGTRADADHVLPGLGVDPSTHGAHAHVAVTFYTVRSADCPSSTCVVDVRMATSVDGTRHWRRPVRLNARAMPLSWLARTTSGYMLADYVATVFSARRAVGVYALARPPQGGRLDEAIHAHVQIVR